MARRLKRVSSIAAAASDGAGSELFTDLAHPANTITEMNMEE
jgi:hypothetical protein